MHELVFIELFSIVIIVAYCITPCIPHARLLQCGCCVLDCVRKASRYCCIKDAPLKTQEVQDLQEVHEVATSAAFVEEPPVYHEVV